MEQEENKIDLNRKAEEMKMWRHVLFFYAKTTAWIVIPLILGAVAGNYVGDSMKSQVYFFLFVILGFGITCYGIYREIKNYKKNLNLPSVKEMKEKIENARKSSPQ